MATAARREQMKKYKPRRPRTPLGAVRDIRRWQAAVCLRCHFDPQVGTEELAHQEMIAAIVYQLTRNLTPEQIKEGGFDAYFVDHTTGIYPQSAAGIPFSASALQCKGDPITDLFEDLAADAAIRNAQLFPLSATNNTSPYCA